MLETTKKRNIKHLFGDISCDRLTGFIERSVEGRIKKCQIIKSRKFCQTTFNGRNLPETVTKWTLPGGGGGGDSLHCQYMLVN